MQLQRLPVKIVNVINNQWMGMVRQWQELLHGGRYSESYLTAVAAGFRQARRGVPVDRGIEGDAHPDELDGVIDRDDRNRRPGDRLNIVVEKVRERAIPMIPSGAAHNEIAAGARTRRPRSPVSEEGMVLVCIPGGARH